jgi:hypothetical protein
VIQYTINLPDSAAHGVRWSRKRFNAALSPVNDLDGNPLPIEQHPDYLADDAAYVQHVMDIATQSYVRNIPKVTRRQVFTGLRAQGLFDTVEALVAQSSQDVKDEWAMADVFLRSNAMLNAMWPLLPQNAGKTQSELDDGLDALFEAFSQL